MAYKILWFSPYALHDTSNGAAISNKLILEKLAERGIEVRALNCAAGDSITGMGFFNRIKQQFPANTKLYEFNDNGVGYHIFRPESPFVKNLTLDEQSECFNLFVQLVEQCEPDLVFGFGGDLLSCSIRREAKVRGISVAYTICNGLHHNFSFIDCDLLISASQATCDIYKEQDGLELHRFGIFIDPTKAKVTEEMRANNEPRYVTMINPSPSKGFAIFAKLVLAYNQKHPEQKQRFLLVNSSDNYEQILASIHDKDGNPLLKRPSEDVLKRLQKKGKPIKVDNPLPYMDRTNHTDDIRQVYGISKVVVVPSLWYESWGRVVSEANLNGIPVLATKNGGLYEAMGNGQGGIQLDIPASCKDDWLCMPTDAEIEPYVEALERLLTEDFSAQCKASSELNDIERSTDRLIELFTPYLEQGAKNKQPRLKSFYYNERFLKERAKKLEQSKQ